MQKPKAEYLLWPPIREQIFYADAVTQGGQRVDFGDNAYAPVDMDIGPEDPRPFVELAATLGQRPHSLARLVRARRERAIGDAVEGRRRELSIDVPRQCGSAPGLDFIREARREGQPYQRRLRASFATWAPVDEPRNFGAACRRSPAYRGLGQREEPRPCRRSVGGGDEQAPGLALASTANPASSAAGRRAGMLPWNHTASPWESGSVLFRSALTAASGPTTRRWPQASPCGGYLRGATGRASRFWRTRSTLVSASAPRSMGTNGAKIPTDRQGGYRTFGRGFVGSFRKRSVRSGKHEAVFSVTAVRAGLRVQHLRSSGWLRVPVAAGKGLSGRTSWPSRRCRWMRHAL